MEDISQGHNPDLQKVHQIPLKGKTRGALVLAEHQHWPCARAVGSGLLEAAKANIGGQRLASCGGEDVVQGLEVILCCLAHKLLWAPPRNPRCPGSPTLLQGFSALEEEVLQ
eukprot:10329750-Lingulodinium_polyedra.AAC.1